MAVLQAFFILTTGEIDKMGNIENIKIFKDTERLCKTNDKLAESIKNSISKQEIILEYDAIDKADRKKYDSRAEIIVSQKRTYEAASSYKEKRVAVLNFASASNPGGGVVKGSSAQEECLCRCSTLYFLLNEKEMWDRFYMPHRNTHNPLHNDDIIYTPDVTVFKTDTINPTLMNEKDWYSVDVITCAAPNLNSRPTNRYNPDDGEAVKISDDELYNIHEKRLRRIMDVAALHRCEVIILGAFGCGAFRNNPSIVAKAARKVLPDYLNAFEAIEFAIYARRDDTRNYDAFNRTLFRL